MYILLFQTYSFNQRLSLHIHNYILHEDIYVLKINCTLQSVLSSDMYAVLPALQPAVRIPATELHFIFSTVLSLPIFEKCKSFVTCASSLH